MPYNRSAAIRITELQHTLLRTRVDPQTRMRLVAEQRTLWEASYPNSGYEEIVRDAT